MTDETPSGDLLGPEEKTALLQLARASILVALTGRGAPPRPEGLGLRAERGAFVTLRRRSDGALRGCIGFVGADRPLVEVVADVAVAAALRDDRFDSVTAAELPLLHLEISVLGPTFRIRPDEVVVGSMGLLVRASGRQGVLLPQVPQEQGWDRDTFLDRTCQKAGLPSSAWRETGTEIYAFRSVAFGD